MAARVNRFGRKPGRGIRPYLLIPKLLCVATYFGGLVSAGAIAWAQTPAEAVALLERADLAGWLCAKVALLVQHGRVLLRMRWLRVKLVTLAIAVPLLHWVVSGRLAAARELGPAADPETLARAYNQFRLALAGAIVVSAWVVFLGRHKPRFGTPVATVAQQRAGRRER